MSAFPLFFAHGRILVPIYLIGVPAAVAAIICFAVALFVGSPPQEKDQGLPTVLTLRRTLNLIGVIFLFVALFSPAFERFVS